MAQAMPVDTLTFLTTGSVFLVVTMTVQAMEAELWRHQRQRQLHPALGAHQLHPAAARPQALPPRPTASVLSPWM